VSLTKTLHSMQKETTEM